MRVGHRLYARGANCAQSQGPDLKTAGHGPSAGRIPPPLGVHLRSHRHESQHDEQKNEERGA